MTNKNCLLIVTSWALIFASAPVYEKYGLVQAFILLAFSSLIRPRFDENVVDAIMSSRKYQYVALGYYLIVLAFVINDVELLWRVSALVFVVIISMPFLLILLWRDFQHGCFHSRSRAKDQH